jgi:hypothetical protein
VTISRGLRLAAIAVAGTAMVAVAPAAALGDARLEVYVGSALMTTLTPLQIYNDSDEDADNEIARYGNKTEPAAGMSVGRLLANYARVSPDSLADGGDAVVVSSAGTGASEALSREEVMDGFRNPYEPSRPNGFAVFGNLGFTEGGPGQINFLRPVRNTTDPPPSQPGTGSDGVAALRVVATLAGALLDVTASCDPAAATVSQSVRCTATPGDGGGDGWTYTWDFGDQSPVVGGQSATHAFAARGTFPVIVTAKHGADAGNASPVTVTVAAPAEDPASPPGPPGGPSPGAGSTRTPSTVNGPSGAPDGSGSAAAPAAANGPDKSKAKRNAKGKDKAKKRTPAKAETPPSTDGGNGGGSGGGGGPGGGSAGGGTGTDGGTGAGAGTTAGSGTPATSGAGDASRPARSGAGGTHASTPGSSADGRRDVVDGVLLTDGGRVFDLAEVADRSPVDALRQQRAARAGDGSSGGGWPAWVGGSAALVGLLLAGGALEQVPAARRRVRWS